MNTINTAVIGLGGRGTGNLRTILKISGVNVTAVCDLYEDRCEQAVKIVTENGGKTPFSSQNYHDILGRSDVEAVMVFTSWESHIEIAIEAMKAGHAVGMEVGGAYSLSECFELVKTQEEKKVPFMLLENCCYGQYEMFAKNMVADGMLGDIVHCHGAYAHDLRDEIITGRENRHYRLNNYINRNCENYPTHELGPIAQILGINHGNRMTSLVSMSSKAIGLNAYINDRKDTIVNKDLIGQKFLQGDIVETLISCEGGETISLRLDTTLPRNYNREFTLHGTKGFYEAATNSLFLDGDGETFDTLAFYKDNIDNAVKFNDRYMPECWSTITEEIIKAGHGGMDYFVLTEFFNMVKNNLKSPIDVYDAAAWMCISCLSEQSIANGSAPVEIPDFTSGMWKKRMV